MKNPPIGGFFVYTGKANDAAILRYVILPSPAGEGVCDEGADE